MRTNLSFGLIQLPCHRPRQKKFNTLDFEIFCQRHTEFCSPPSHFSGFLQPFYGLFSSRFCPGLIAFFPIMFFFFSSQLVIFQIFFFTLDIALFISALFCLSRYERPPSLKGQNWPNGNHTIDICGQTGQVMCHPIACILMFALLKSHQHWEMKTAARCLLY